MDEPDLAPERFIGALRGLRRVNIATRGAGILWPSIRAAAREKPGRTLRILDIASGGGDIAISTARKLAAGGYDAEVTGCDLSPLAVQHATDSAESRSAKVSFFQMNAVEDPIPEGYDILMTSLFLHHLSDPDAKDFLQRATAAARHSLLVQDLNRCAAGWCLAYAGVRLLGCNDVCHEDGPKSVECAFTPAEALDLARQAGLESARVSARFPYRYLLEWTRE